MSTSTSHTTHATRRRAPGAAVRLSRAVHDLATDRVIGIVGAITVFVATGLSWYSQQVTIRFGQLVDTFTTHSTLWEARNLAAWLLCIAAAIGLGSLLVTPRREQIGGTVAAVAGFGIALYGFVALFVVPAAGSLTVVGGHVGTVASTSLDAGPFVAMIGGVLLWIGGFAASIDSTTIATRGRYVASDPDA
jgi:tryptophan-associated transmembrane protein